MPRPATTIILLLGFSILSLPVLSQATRPRPPQRFDYMGARWNEGPLDCGNFRINWAKTSSPRFHGAIQVEGANGLFILYEWTQPHYNPSSKEIIMDLEGRLLGGPESGFLRLQAKSSSGATLATAQVGTFNGVHGGRTGAGTVRVNPISYGNPSTYTIVLSFGDGGSCPATWIGDYAFNKVVSQTPKPPPPAPVPATIAGTWSWSATCTSGTANGYLAFGNPDAYGGFSGSFSTVGGAGTMSAGRMTGHRISFSRHLGNEIQYWQGTMSSATTIEGSIALPGGGSCSINLVKH